MRQSGKSIRDSVNIVGREGKGREGKRSSYAWLHLHILLRIVARLAANRKMRHRQPADRDRGSE